MSESVYITNAFLKPILSLLNRNWHVAGAWDARVDKQSITALATTVWDPINAQFMSQFPNLKIICHLGLGTDNLDVYAHEPEVLEALRMLDNVVLSPHMGSSTKENLHVMFTLQAQQLNDYLESVCKK